VFRHVACGDKDFRGFPAARGGYMEHGMQHGSTVAAHHVITPTVDGEVESRMVGDRAVVGSGDRLPNGLYFS
jgi:hypothetical protein